MTSIKDISKILIIQLRPFGDVLLTTSYLSAIREKYPAAQIDFLVSKPYDSILINNPFIDNVISVSKHKGLKYILSRVKLFAKVRKMKYDLVIDQQNGTGTAQICFMSGAHYRLGYEDSKHRYAHNLHAPRGEKRYAASRKFDIISPLGIEEKEYSLYYYISPDSISYVESWFVKNNLNSDVICFSPGSPVKKKQWDLDSYAKTADMIIRDLKIPVVFLWAPNELDDVNTIIAGMKEKPILAPPTTFNQAAAFLQKVTLLICNDGGLNHLSVATNTPALAIFGNTNPDFWSPQGVFDNHFHIFNPDFQRMTDSTFGITSEQVLKKVETILQKLK